MMMFLEKLYSYEYFPQILFTTIAVLLILLVVVILFGKKDEKIRKEEETKRLELAGLDAFAKEETQPTSLEAIAPETDTTQKEALLRDLDMGEEPMISNIAEPQVSNEVQTKAQDLIDNALNNSIVNNDIVEAKNVVTSEPSISSISENNESFMMPDFEIFKEEEKVGYQTMEAENEQQVPLSLDELHQKNENTEQRINVEPFKEVDLENTAVLPEFNFEELASSISKELDEINKLQEQSNKLVEKEKTTIPNKVDVTPIKEVTKFTPSSVFSSVYVNKEREITPAVTAESVKSEEIKPILEEKTEEEIPVIRNVVDEPAIEIKAEPIIAPVEKQPEPVKPVVTNPFIFDMPAKKEEKVETPKSTDNMSNVNVPDFSSFQNETYDIK